MKKKIILLSSIPSSHLQRWFQLIVYNYRVRVFDLSGNNNVSKFNSGDYKSFNIRNSNKLSQVVNAIKLYVCCIKKETYINIHFVSFYLAFFSIFIPSKVILSFWGSDALIQYSSSKGIKRLLYNIAFKRAAKITVNSKIVLNELTAFSNKTLFISWPIDNKDFYIATQDKKKDARQYWGIPEGKIVLYSNRIGRELYNILDIVKAFQVNFKSSGKYLLFVHFPPGSDEKYVEACVELLGEVEGIYTRKDLSLDERRMQYQASDYYLSFPESDSYPSSLIEAAACGLTLVCSSSTRSYDDIELDFKMIRLPLSELGPASIEVDETWKKTAREKNFAAIDAKFSQERFMSSIEELYR